MGSVERSRVGQGPRTVSPEGENPEPRLNRRLAELRSVPQVVGKTLFVSSVLLGAAALHAREDWINFGSGDDGNDGNGHDYASSGGSSRDKEKSRKGMTFDEAADWLKTYTNAQRKNAQQDYDKAKRKGDERGMERAQAQLDKHDRTLKDIGTAKNVNKWRKRLFGSDDD